MKDGPSLGNDEGENDSENDGITLGDCDSEGYSEGLLDGYSERTFDGIKVGLSLRNREGGREYKTNGPLLGNS